MTSEATNEQSYHHCAQSLHEQQERDAVVRAAQKLGISVRSLFRLAYRRIGDGTDYILLYEKYVQSDGEDGVSDVVQRFSARVLQLCECARAGCCGFVGSASCVRIYDATGEVDVFCSPACMGIRANTHEQMEIASRRNRLRYSRWQPVFGQWGSDGEELFW